MSHWVVCQVVCIMSHWLVCQAVFV
jgi:hypothetical protein